jgi:hypothetical protein
MPLNPKRVQAVFVEDPRYRGFAGRAAILDREHKGRSEFWRRIEAILKADDRFNDFVSRRLDGPHVGALQIYADSERRRSGTMD